MRKDIDLLRELYDEDLSGAIQKCNDFIKSIEQDPRYQYKDDLGIVLTAEGQVLTEQVIEVKEVLRVSAMDIHARLMAHRHTMKILRGEIT